MSIHPPCNNAPYSSLYLSLFLDHILQKFPPPHSWTVSRCARPLASVQMWAGMEMEGARCAEEDEEHCVIGGVVGGRWAQGVCPSVTSQSTCAAHG